MYNDLTKLCVINDCTIEQIIHLINQNSLGVALIVDDAKHLIGTITDGDIRRAILAGITLDQSVALLLTQKGQSQTAPITAPIGHDHAALLHLMKLACIRHIPLLNSDNQVVDLVTWENLLPDEELPLQAIIMAGGLGTRLRPLTEELPKPMLPIGNQPLMARIIQQLKDAGVRTINVTTHYRADKIKEYFGNGQAFGVQLNYVEEEQPLGTGGALGLMPVPEKTTLVINGDILTQVDFNAMLSFHYENHADITVAIRQYQIEVPFGVLECEGTRVVRMTEKPQIKFFVNAGIYLLEPYVFRFMPNAQKFNMTDLIQWLIDAGKTVVSFPILEYWLDIGKHADYEKAQSDFVIINSSENPQENK